MCKNSLKVSKTMPSRLVEKYDDLEQYGRRLCLWILDAGGDDSETSDEGLTNAKNYLRNWSLISQKAVLIRRIGLGRKHQVGLDQ